MIDRQYNELMTLRNEVHRQNYQVLTLNNQIHRLYDKIVRVYYVILGLNHVIVARH